MKTKLCKKCGHTKSISDFYANKSKKDGLNWECKSCFTTWRHTPSGKKSRRREAIRAMEIGKTKQYYDNKMKNPKKKEQALNNSRKARSKRIKLGKEREYLATKRAFKLKATPKWLTEKDNEQINFIYSEAARLSICIGIKMHVDHIVPLKGNNVCGLHVPWNLQIITARENIIKGNKYDE